eukprot:2866944-Amphidinium_carterae.1
MMFAIDMGGTRLFDERGRIVLQHREDSGMASDCFNSVRVIGNCLLVQRLDSSHPDTTPWVMSQSHTSSGKAKVSLSSTAGISTMSPSATNRTGFPNPNWMR